MKRVLLTALAVFFMSCSTDDSNLQNNQNRFLQSNQVLNENVTPVRLDAWVYSKSKGKHYINFRWLSDYGYPNLAYTPHYATIYMNGTLVEDFVQRPFNQYSIEVNGSWTTVYTISVTQTVIGVGTSLPMVFQGYRQY